MADVFFGQFRDVDQAFDAAVQHGERAELGQAGDLGFHQLTDFQALDLVLPGIFLSDGGWRGRCGVSLRRC